MTRDGIPTAHALTEEVAAALPGTPMAIPPPATPAGTARSSSTAYWSAATRW